MRWRSLRGPCLAAVIFRATLSLRGPCLAAVIFRATLMMYASFAFAISHCTQFCRLIICLLSSVPFKMVSVHSEKDISVLFLSQGCMHGTD